MSTKDRLLDWFKTMGYSGKLPESFDNICNPSSSFIWEQIIEKVKPKQDVEVCRRNIIMNRLRSKVLRDQDECPYPIKEIENYITKSKLEREVDKLKNSVLDKEVSLDKLTHDNKTKCTLENILQQKIKENEERTYLIEKKSKALEKEISHAEDMLTHAKNLTPVEADENPESFEITQTLQKCSEKLEKLISEMSHATDGTVTVLRTVQKTGRKYMTSTRKHVYSTSKMQPIKNEKMFSTVAKSLYVEDNRNRLGSSVCLSKCFSEIKQQKCNKDEVTVFTDNMETYMQADENKENQRESLGILPDACLDIFDADLRDDVFKTPLKEMPIFETVNYKLSTTKQRTPLNGKLSTMSVISEGKKQCMYGKLYNDDFVVERIRNLIHSHNRPTIWNSLQALCENVLFEMQNSIVESSTSSSSKTIMDESDTAKLHYAHIKAELDAMQYRISNEELKKKIEKCKKQITKTLLMNPLLRDNQTEVQKVMELQIEEAKLDAVISCMKKEISAARKLESSNELQLVKNKTKEIKQDVICNLHVVQEHMGEIHKIFESINQTRNNTTCCVRRLNRFISDMQWVTPLTESLHTKELVTFTNFPVEYNRRFTYTEPKIFYRDICTNVCPSYVDLDSNQVNMLTSLLDNPFTPPEIIIANILKAKIWLCTMNGMQNAASEARVAKYSVMELKNQENYVPGAVDKLNAVLHSPLNVQVFSSPAKIKEIMQLWKEMPFRNFISPQRLVENKTYHCYENIFNNFYNAM